MNLMRKITCGFEELSLSLLEIQGNVKGEQDLCLLKCSARQFFYKHYNLSSILL